MLVDGAIGDTQGHSLLKDLPVVNIHEDSGIIVLLDEGCNSTVHEWARRIEVKLESLGFSSKFDPSHSKGFRGLSWSAQT